MSYELIGPSCGIRLVSGGFGLASWLSYLDLWRRREERRAEETVRQSDAPRGRSPLHSGTLYTSPTGEDQHARVAIRHSSSPSIGAPQVLYYSASSRVRRSGETDSFEELPGRLPECVTLDSALPCLPQTRSDQTRHPAWLSRTPVSPIVIIRSTHAEAGVSLQQDETADDVDRVSCQRAANAGAV